MTPRESVIEALRYLSHPNRIVESMEIRAGLREVLAELPMTQEEKDRHQAMCGAYTARKQIHVKPNHILDNA